VNQLLAAFKEASETKDKPTCILAKTFKGSGFKGIENELDWHGKPLGDKAGPILAHLKELVHAETLIRPEIAKITAKAPEIKKGQAIHLSSPPNYDGKKEIATRLAYGTALEKLGKSSEYVIALDGDTKNSTYSIKFHDAFPKRFVECYIAEQNMVAVAIGIATRQRYTCFVHTFAAFLIRAADQIRMGAISFTQVKYVGSHAGVSIGEDGPSQMALEDFAFFRTVPNIVCFYPSDAVSAERAAELAANYPGAVYIRTSRPNFPILYKNDEVFQIGQAKVKTKMNRKNEKENFCF
jgi:transketolase